MRKQFREKPLFRFTLGRVWLDVPVMGRYMPAMMVESGRDRMTVAKELYQRWKGSRV